MMLQKFRIVLLGSVVLSMGLASPSPAAEEESPGRALFLKSKCQQCHAVSAVKIFKADNGEPEETVAGEEKVEPPDLSGVGKAHPADWISRWLKKEEANKEGRKHKKKFKGSDADLQALSAWLAALKYDSPKDGKGGGVAGAKADTVAKAKRDTVSKVVAVGQAKPIKVVASGSGKDSTYKAIRDSLYRVLRDSISAAVKDSVSKVSKDCMTKEKKDSAAKPGKAK